MRVIFSFLLILLIIGLSSAGWLKTYGSERQDYLEDGVLLDDGGYLLVGYTQTTAGDFDVWCLWLDEYGNEVDSRTYGGPYNDKARGITKIDDGFIIVGETNSYGISTPGYSNFFILRIDNDGNLIWQIPSDGDTTTGGEYDDGLYNVVYIPAESTYIAVGQYWVDFTDYQQEPFVFVGNPYDMSGDSHIISTGQGADEFGDVTFSGDTIFACGDTKNYGSGIPAYSNGYLMGMGLDLSIEFNIGIGGENNDKFYGIKYCDGKIYLVGETASFDVDMTDIFAVCYSTAFGVEWEQTFGGIYTDVGEDVAVVDSMMFILGRTNSTGAGYDDFYLIKTDISDGSEISERTYGGTGDDWASSIIELDNGLLLVGSSSSPDFDAEDWDGMAVKVGFDGDTVSGIAEFRQESSYLLSVYPNPFNSSVKITSPAESKVEIFDLRGNLIASPTPSIPHPEIEGKSFSTRDKVASIYRSQMMGTFIWCPDQTIPSGTYFVRVKIPRQNDVYTKRILYVK